MKLRRVRIQNVRSFLDAEELLLDGDISILIGPNGGGKTNLLDAITMNLRRHLLASWSHQPNPTSERPFQIQLIPNNLLHQTALEPHSQGSGKNQIVEFEVEVTSTDLENMRRMKEDAGRLCAIAAKNGYGVPLNQAEFWDLSQIHKGDRFIYRVDQNSLEQPQSPASKQFHEYLTLFEVDGIVRGSIGEARLSVPVLSLPANRAAGGIQSAVSLPGFDELNIKNQVDAANSRTPASVVNLAVGRMAQKHRLLQGKDLGGSMAKFMNAPENVLLTRVLGALGYTWELVELNQLSNHYDVRLTKQGISFLVGNASSGEKELLTYLFGIIALNVRDALILIDEPELHLHPRWQKSLLALFEELAEATGNQFLLATHSPAFVSPSSIQYVSRVFSEHQQSRIVRLNDSSLPSPKHLFRIVNSQNNERMFFADRVILVEGISDRLIFQSLLDTPSFKNELSGFYEIIEVGGKTNFESYKKVLSASEVPFAVIADLDHVDQIGTGALKGLFTLHEKKVKADLLADNSSVDGQSFVIELEQAIVSGDLENLRRLWTYIKARRSKLKLKLSAEEQILLETFISSMREEATYVLRLGAIEAYLPEGYGSKDVDKVIELLEQPNWLSLLPEGAQAELIEIASSLSAWFRSDGAEVEDPNDGEEGKVLAS